MRQLAQTTRGMALVRGEGQIGKKLWTASSRRWWPNLLARTSARGQQYPPPRANGAALCEKVSAARPGLRFHFRVIRRLRPGLHSGAATRLAVLRLHNPREVASAQISVKKKGPISGATIQRGEGKEGQSERRCKVPFRQLERLSGRCREHR